MSEEESHPDISQFLWSLGYILTSIMQISHSNNVPILMESFKAGSELFDAIGEYNYGIYREKKILKYIKFFNTEFSRENRPAYDSIINYAKDFSKDLELFMKENNIE